jgi:DNA-directed RNA polymerase specialized sigma24 family protein
MLDRKESTIQTQLATARKKLKIELEKEGFIYAGK